MYEFVSVTQLVAIYLFKSRVSFRIFVKGGRKCDSRRVQGVQGLYALYRIFY